MIQFCMINTQIACVFTSIIKLIYVLSQGVGDCTYDYLQKKQKNFLLDKTFSGGFK